MHQLFLSIAPTPKKQTGDSGDNDSLHHSPAKYMALWEQLDCKSTNHNPSTFLALQVHSKGYSLTHQPAIPVGGGVMGSEYKINDVCITAYIWKVVECKQWSLSK